MEDLIRRSDAIKAVRENDVCCYCSNTKVLAEIQNLPTIEPKRGEWIEWIDCEGEVFWKCSACGQVSEASVAGILYNFCPFCGADMRERESE